MASFDDNPSPLSIELKEDETKDVDSSTYSVNIEQVKSFGAESSLGQDLSTLSSQSSKFDQDTSELDELLQQQHLRAGWFGLVERLPLFVKLFLMLAIALLGLIALGCYIAATQAKSIKNSRLNRSIGTLAIATGQLIHEIQRERDVSFNLVVTNSTRMQQQFEIEVLHTDKMYASFQRIVKKQTLALGVADTYFLDVFEEKYCFLPENRIETRKAIFSTSRQIFFTYSNCTNALFSFMQSYTADAKNSRMINALNNLMQLQDNAATTRGAVTNAIFLKGMTQLRYSTMVESFTNERLLETFLYASAEKSVKDLYTEKVVPLNIQPASIVSAAVADYFYPLHNVTNFDEFWAISTARIDAVQEVCDFILSEIQRQAQEDMSKAAGGISALIIVIVLLLICSIVSAAIFSKAITGPWRRIIEVQETTIKKFVPKGFLRLLKCYRLADITLGKSVERDLTIMFADIRNYTQMSENMSPPQNFAFLNRYLASVGPVIRKYGGYIDKFMGDGLMACFPNTQAGLKSALEVQDVVNRLNMENTQDPAIRLGIGVHTGRVMIGAIGEDERMEGTLISDAVNLTSRLETLTKAFRAKVLTTSETMKRLKQLSDFPYRPLGYVKVKGKKQFVKVYELIDRNEPWKLDTAKEFKSAVDHMINHSYESAMILLEDITSKYPEDVGAQRVKSSCAIGYEVFREQVKNLQIHAALQDTVMKQAFLQFCTDERSEENFKFWQATEDYRQTDDDIKRIVLTKKIFQTFLSANAKHQVNTSDESKKKVKDAIISYDESLVYPPATLFNDLQTEIEILMNDTYTRFKKSSAMFMDAFRKVVPVPLVHIMDDDTL